MKIYTKKGDGGNTSLFGGRRVLKNHIRIECVGNIDEANSTIGFLRSKLGDHPWQNGLMRIQVDLMNLMSHLARPSDASRENPNPLPDPVFMEDWMDDIELRVSPSEYFLLPGGTEISAICHMIRTQVRRAERSLVSLMQEDTVPDCSLPYLNRMSDLFFVLAREELFRSGIDEEKVRPFLYKKKNK